MQTLQSSIYKQFIGTNACISLTKNCISVLATAQTSLMLKTKKELQNFFIWKTVNGEAAKYVPKKWFQSNFIMSYSSPFNRKVETVKA
jgi:hypothetical protein